VRGSLWLDLGVLDSGLLVASKYPIVATKFARYPNGAGEDVLAAKGALFAVVEVPQVGLVVVGNTHLNAGSDHEVRLEQAEVLLGALRELREEVKSAGKSLAGVAVTGDWNIDGKFFWELGTPYARLREKMEREGLADAWASISELTATPEDRGKGEGYRETEEYLVEYGITSDQNKVPSPTRLDHMWVSGGRPDKVTVLAASEWRADLELRKQWHSGSAEALVLLEAQCAARLTDHGAITVDLRFPIAP